MNATDREKTRVCIVGLKANQQNAVKEKCRQLAKLRFVDKRRPVSELPETDYCVLMTRFLRHYWTEASYAHLGRDRVCLHRGGVAHLVDLILELCAGATGDESTT